ncbi:DUF484 family protein [Donghicola tyrosinivorans]|uniref:DUF484 family protein n=1 Tax=Donghicola tyrosinivorans TaxID=1652492 RepID=A0A2T0WQ67_9RHOB|nr:DUF484 family protein [Donghicola tyrosinivorans]PRY88825.1 hypothetical protein CLV74_107167 [Donghicola tyrosinivorans]
MSSPKIDAQLRARILADPDLILDDRDLMHALISANERAMGSNIVDLRGLAMERLETRLDRLEDTHRTVIAAAYENLAGTNQVHRALLKMLDPVSFEDFLKGLGTDVAQILRVDCLRLVLETQTDGSEDNTVRKMGAVLSSAPEGFIREYLTDGRGGQIRQVTLRQIHSGEATVHGSKADDIRSEACLLLNLGTGRLPGLLVMGSEDPHQFSPQQGTDLLAFFAGVFERIMRRWLS